MIKLWRKRHLFAEVKITTFKSLAISKKVYLALLTIVLKNVIKELNEIKKNFLCSNKICKTEHGYACNDSKNESLKNVDIELKIALLNCS